MAGIPVGELSDICVDPLIQTAWDQQGHCDQAAFNYFTPQWMWDANGLGGHSEWVPGHPNNYPCGCLATALAQLMAFHRHPAAPPSDSYDVTVIGDPNDPNMQETVPRKMLGGDGGGGLYDWDLILEAIDCTDPNAEAQRMAIGALCHDVGAGMHMQYHRSGSKPSQYDLLSLPSMLKTTFKYANARLGLNDGDDIGAGLLGMLNPSLDAKSPVVLAISNSAGGDAHAVVCDGYGYIGPTAYYHLNLGSSAYQQECGDIWYELVPAEIQHCCGTRIVIGEDALCLGMEINYDTVYLCIYNVFVDEEGEIISGRVFDAGGEPKAGVLVYGQSDDGTDEPNAMTDARGIFAFVGCKANTRYAIWLGDSAYPSVQKVATGSSEDEEPTSGNVWGVFFYQVPPAPIHVAQGDYVRDSNCPIGSEENPHMDIQAAINAAKPGATVLVAAGTYAGTLDLKGKPLILMKVPGDPGEVVLRSNGVRGFYFRSGEKATSILRDFTITNLRSVHGRGAGIFCEAQCSPRIVDCTFTKNRAVTYTDPFNPLKTWYGNGGGLYAVGSTVELIGCHFIENTSESLGGGAYILSSGPAIVSDCSFAGNRGYWGGALYVSGARIVIENCSFTGNLAEKRAGGVYVGIRGVLHVRNSTFATNSATGEGGGFAIAEDTLVFGTPPRVSNCVFWGNQDQNGAVESSQISGPISEIVCSCIQAWTGLLGGTGNIGLDPMFLREPDEGEDGWHDDPATQDIDESANNDYGDLRLQPDSPCIDTGDPNLLPNSELDLASNPRVVDGNADGIAVIDMGAYEFQGQ